MNSSGKRFGTLLEMKGGEIVEADAVEEPVRRATAAQLAARKIKQPKGHLHGRHIGASSAHSNRIKPISTPSSVTFSPTTPTPTNGQPAQQPPFSTQTMSNPFSTPFSGAGAYSNPFTFTPSKPPSKLFQPFTPASTSSQAVAPPASAVSTTSSIFSGISASTPTFDFSPATGQRPVSNPFSGQAAGTSPFQFGFSATTSTPKQQQTPATDSTNSSLFNSTATPIKFPFGATPSMLSSQISESPSMAVVNNAGYSSAGGLRLPSGTIGTTPIDSAPPMSSQQSTTSPFAVSFGQSGASSASPLKLVPDVGKSTTNAATSAGSQSYPPAPSIFTLGRPTLVPPTASEPETSQKPTTASISNPTQTQPAKFTPTGGMGQATPPGTSKASSSYNPEGRQSGNIFSAQNNDASPAKWATAQLNEKINKDFETPHHLLSSGQAENLLDTSKFQPPPSSYTTDQTIAYVRDLRVRRLNEAFVEAMNVPEDNCITDWTGMMVQYIKLMGMIQYSTKWGPSQFVFASKHKAHQNTMQKTNATNAAPLPTLASQTSSKVMGILNQPTNGSGNDPKNGNKFDSQPVQTPTTAKQIFSPVPRPSSAQAPAGFMMASTQPNPTPFNFTQKPTPVGSGQQTSAGPIGFTPKLPTTQSNQPTSTGLTGFTPKLSTTQSNQPMSTGLTGFTPKLSTTQSNQPMSTGLTGFTPKLPTSQSNQPMSTGPTSFAPKLSTTQSNQPTSTVSTSFTLKLPATQSNQPTSTGPTGFTPKLSTTQEGPAASGAQTGFKPLFEAQPSGTGSVGGFFAQFAQAAKKTEEAEKKKRKAEDFDSDEENEQEWEAKYEREREEKRAKIEAEAEAAKTRFSFIPTINEPHPTGLAPNSGQPKFTGLTAKFGQTNSTRSFETTAVASANDASEERRKRKADHFDHDGAVKESGTQDEHQEKKMRREADAANTAPTVDNDAQNDDIQSSLKTGHITGSGATKSNLLHPSVSREPGRNVFAQSMSALRSQTTSPAASIFEEARSSNRPKTIRSDNIFGFLSNQNSDVEDADAKALAAVSDDEENDEDVIEVKGAKEPTAPSDSLLNKVTNDEVNKPVQSRPLFASAFQPLTKDGSTTPVQSTPRSDGLFGRISRDEIDDPSQSTGRYGKRVNYITAAEVDRRINVIAPVDSEPADSTNGVGDHTWKPDSPIKFASALKPATTQGSSILAAAAAKSPFLFASNSSGQSALTSAFSSAPTSRAISPAASNLSNNDQESANHDGKLQAVESLGGYAVTESLASESQAGDVDGDDDDRMGLDKDLEGHNTRWEGEDVKAYRFDVVKKKWALKGVGPMFLLEHDKSKVFTILMKKRPSGGIVLNARLDPKFDYTLAKDAKCAQFPVADAAGIRSWMIKFHDAEEAQKFVQEAEAGKTWSHNLQEAENEDEV